MRLALTIETSVGISDEKTAVIIHVSNRLSKYFAEKDYGMDVITVLIGVICVAPEFAKFHKIRKPRYTAFRKYFRDDIEIVEDRVFCFDLNLDFDKFRLQTDDENQAMLSSEIVASLSNLDQLPKRVKDFDKQMFERDVTNFLLVESSTTLT